MCVQRWVQLAFVAAVILVVVTALAVAEAPSAAVR